MSLPVLDPRNRKDLIKKMKEMVPFYTPEWSFTPDDPDPGAALFFIFASMYQETIKRYNQAPFKNFLAFLNLLDVSALPSKPARAFITFVLSGGATEPVLVPARARLTAVSPEGGQVIFETERNLLVTPANLAAAYNVSGKHDRIIEVSASELTKAKALDKAAQPVFSFPETENLQKHCFYLGHGSLFNIRETALIEIEVINSLKQFKQQSFCELLANPDLVEWTYLGEREAVPFDEVSSRGNKLILKKTSPGLIAQREIEGLTSRWIRCEVKKERLSEVSEIALDEIEVKARFYDTEDQRGLAPDQAFHGDVPINPAGDYPFGENLGIYETFYLSSQEVFSKRGAVVTAIFDLRFVDKEVRNVKQDIQWKMIMKQSDLEEAELPRVYIVKVLWEYWNGSSWAKIPGSTDYEEIFMQAAQARKRVVFQCPKDIMETRVNEQPNYWIRIRVLSIQNPYAPNAIYQIPWIGGLTLNYDYPEGGVRPEHGLADNNLEFVNLDLGRPGRLEEFQPFRSVDTKRPALYLGFNRPLRRGPISIFLSLERQKPVDGETPMMEWQYLRFKGGVKEWADLKAVDETRGLTESGLVVFAGPTDSVSAKLLGKEMFWLRVINSDGRFDRETYAAQAPKLKGFYINTTRAVQEESIEQEWLGRTDGEPDREFVLARSPVISEEIWVDEAAHLSEAERQSLLEDESTEVRPVRDEWGNVRQFWVKWTAVDDFYESRGLDRHYVIDRPSGRVKFGNGEYGRIPPSSGVDNIKARYKIGGGSRGNVGSLEINGLQNPYAYINEIYNPEAAVDGCEMETLAQAVSRGPQILKHRNRAVTADDFQWLARQVAHNIAKVKCLSNINSQGQKESGCLTLVALLPDGGGQSFPDFKRRLEKRLSDQAANLLAFPGKIQVIEPVLLEISIRALLGVSDVDDMALTEKEALDKLNGFLDSITGNRGGRGWEIGRFPHISVFYSLLKTIRTVNYVEKVSMAVHLVEYGQRQEIDLAIVNRYPHGIVANGSHQVAVKVIE